MGYAPENCLVLEDSRPGIQEGMSAEMEVMHFIGGSPIGTLKKSDWSKIILSGAFLSIRHLLSQGVVVG